MKIVTIIGRTAAEAFKTHSSSKIKKCFTLVLFQFNILRIGIRFKQLYTNIVFKLIEVTHQIFSQEYEGKQMPTSLEQLSDLI